MTEPTNLHALLGDRYDAVIKKALDAVDTPDHGYQVMRGNVDERDVSTALAAVLPDLLAEARRDGAWDAIEHMGDELGWTHTPNCAGRVSFPTSPPVCICHADVLRDMRGRFNYPADHDRTDHA